MEHQPIDEKKIAGASYIVNFYNEVQNLKINFSAYLNVMIEIESNLAGGKIDSIEMTKKLTDEQIGAVKVICQNVRHTAILTYTSYKSLISSVSTLKPVSEMESNYKKIRDTFVIDKDVLESYVTEMNTFLLKDIIKGLLETSQNIIQNLYKDAS